MIAAVLVLIGAGAILMMHSLFLSYSAIVVLTLVSVCAIISLATMRRDMETNFDSPNRSLHAPTIPEKAVRLDATIAEAYGNAQAIVTIISDDGNYDSAVNLHAVFAKRKLRCTVAGVVKIVKRHKKKWNALLADDVINMVSHSYTHVPMDDSETVATDFKALKHEIVDAGKWFADWLQRKPISFVCPHNKMCELGYKILEDNGYWAVRRGARGFNSLSPEAGRQPGQWLNLMVQGIRDQGVDKSARNQWIDTAINDKKWLIEMWHNVMPEDDHGYQTLLISEAEEHLNYVATKSQLNDIWVASYDDAVKYLLEKQHAHVQSYVHETRLHIFIELTNDKMSYATFCHPLTLSVKLPAGLTVSDATQATVAGGALTVDLVPGKEFVVNLQPEAQP